MSWHIKRAGKGIDVAAEIGKAAEREAEASHNSAAAKEAIKRSGKLATELLTSYPEKGAVVTLSGHVDSHQATVKVEIEVLYNPYEG